MKNFNKSRNENKGITLISLVITIIVLIILSGVSIATLFGENSTINRANEAKNATAEKNKEDKAKMAYIGAYSNGMGSVTKELFEAELEKEFGKNGFSLEIDSTSNEWYVMVDNVERFRIPIPESAMEEENNGN